MSYIVLFVALIVAPLFLGFFVNVVQERIVEEGVPIVGYAVCVVLFTLYAVLGYALLSHLF